MKKAREQKNEKRDFYNGRNASDCITGQCRNQCLYWQTKKQHWYMEAEIIPESTLAMDEHGEINILISTD